MFKKVVCLFSFALILSIATNNASAELVAHWKFDEGSGTIATDSVGGYNGTLIGDTAWTAGILGGALEFDGGGDYVDCGNDPVFNPTGSFSVTYWAYIRDWSVAWAEAMIGKGGDNDRGGWTIRRGGSDTIMLTMAGAGGNLTGNAAPPLNEWVHIAAIYDQENGQAYIYFNGVDEILNAAVSGTVNVSNNNLYLGTRGDGSGSGPDAWGPAFFDGLLDDVRFYDHALSLEEVAKSMVGVSPGYASKPSPEADAIDVLRDQELSWKPGDFANTHNVFFGTDFDDVNDSTVTSPLGSTVVVEGLDNNSYDPGRMEYGMTYYWRVDEVNAPSDPGIYKGETWSFTIEAYSVKIPSGNITVTAISQSSDDSPPENTINESGLNPDDMDLHSYETIPMWLTTGTDVTDVWIQYDFDKLYKLHQMLVWNYNDRLFLWRAGFRDVTVEYSEDGQTWTELEGVPEFAVAPGTNNYKYNTVVEFNSAAAKHVKLTAHSNWSDAIPIPNYGLSEVRFMYVPVWAREPIPENQESDVAVDQTLSWRAGREAAEHDIYLSTDEQAVIDGTADVETVDQASYSTSLGIGRTYFWRVDESNDAETPSVWEGDVWSFSTPETIIVEDFEDYNDTDGYTVWDTWKSGYDSADNGGSVMGHEFAPYAEQTNVHGGDQSAPVYYDNTGSFNFSQVVVSTSELPIGSDWSIGDPETLVIRFFGDSENGADQLYAKINNKEVTYSNPDDLTRPWWTQWNIDLASLGVNLNNVSSITIGLRKVGAGGSGIVFFDDIMLYREAPAVPSEMIWIQAEDYVTLTAPLQVMNEIEGAIGGEYIQVANDATASSAEPPATGIATYSFDVQGGQYIIYGRASVQTGFQDSFWVRIQGATSDRQLHSSGWCQWNNIPFGAAWHWDDIHSSTVGTDAFVTWTMPAGTYTLEIAYREVGDIPVALDAIVIESQQVPEPEPDTDSIITNPSFEDDGEIDPGTPSGWTWNSQGSLGASAGGESNTDGNHYLWMGNGAVLYQTTGEVIAAEGLTYKLQVDARNSWNADPKIVIYYDDGSNRVELASVTQQMSGGTPVTMEVNATTTAASVEKNIGVELTIGNYPGNRWAHYDNVRLSLSQ